jgi:hypothetical protein
VTRKQLGLFGREAPSVAVVMRWAKKLSALVPRRSTFKRVDGVVPMTRADALAWVGENSLEVLGTEGIDFKLGVLGEGGTMRSGEGAHHRRRAR